MIWEEEVKKQWPGMKRLGPAGIAGKWFNESELISCLTGTHSRCMGNRANSWFCQEEKLKDTGLSGRSVRLLPAHLPASMRLVAWWLGTRWTVSSSEPQPREVELSRACMRGATIMQTSSPNYTKYCATTNFRGDGQFHKLSRLSNKQDKEKASIK